MVKHTVALCTLSSNSRTLTAVAWVFFTISSAINRWCGCWVEVSDE